MASMEMEEIALLRQRINRLEAQLDFLYRHFGVTYVENSSGTDDPRVVAALRANNMLEAIKLYRERTNSSLAEAKSAVEAMRSRLGI